MPSIRTFVALGLWVAAPALAADAPAPAPAPARTPTPAPAPVELAEPAIPGTGREADFLRAMHTSIHWRWMTKFIDGVAKKRPATDPINKRSLAVDLIFTVRWDGSPAQITVAETSGNAEFDQAAIAIIKNEGNRYPIPPVETYGDDGIAHLRWVFARDHRLCGLAEVRRFEAPLKEALPRLFLQGRTKEALLRAARYSRGGDANAMAEFARAYLARPFTDPALDARAGAALVRAGDAKQIDRIKPALARPDSVAVVAPALAAAKVDLCALVQADLKSSKPEAVASATGVLRAAGTELPAGSPCFETMTALAKEWDPLESTCRHASLSIL